MRLQRLILILSLILGLELLIVGMQTAITSLTYANSCVDAANNWPLNAEDEKPYSTSLYSFDLLASYGYPPLFGGYSSFMIFGGYMPYPVMNAYIP